MMLAVGFYRGPSPCSKLMRANSGAGAARQRNPFRSRKGPFTRLYADNQTKPASDLGTFSLRANEGDNQGPSLLTYLTPAESGALSARLSRLAVNFRRQMPEWPFKASNRDGINRSVLRCNGQTQR
jgi:hypothetical protein